MLMNSMSKFSEQEKTIKIVKNFYIFFESDPVHSQCYDV